MILPNWISKWGIKEDDHVKKTRRPYNTAFRQQRLKAWQPIFTPQSVLPLLILIACIFAPIGIGLLVSATNVQDLVVDYTECDLLNSNDEFANIPKNLFSYHFKRPATSSLLWRLETNADGDKTCILQFQIPNEVKKPIYVFYKLTNYNQNHRKYIDSFDLNQLNGEAVSAQSLQDTCDPLREIAGKTVYPCGLIANSLFNDTYAHYFTGVGSTDDFILTNNNTAWSTDRHRYKKTTYDVSEIVPPPNWAKMFPNGYTNDNIPDLQNWEEFKVWMRPAALPTFYKKILKNETSTLFPGTYQMSIGLNYPVKSFNGTKSFVLTTNSIVGARNISLGILYLVVAGISVLFAIIFLIKILIQPRVTPDHEYLNYTLQKGPIKKNSKPASNSSIPLREIL